MFTKPEGGSGQNLSLFYLNGCQQLQNIGLK